MDRREITERVAAGLRKMEVTPSALLYREEYTDYEWDNKPMLGLPVLKCNGIISAYDDYATNVLIVLPVGVGIADLKRFVDGYDEEEVG